MTRKLRYRLLAVAAVAGAVILHLAAQFAVVATRPGWSFSGFRGYYAGDQLSYLAIVANAAQGQFDSFEPFTGTGSIYFPRLYYLALGAVAHLTGASPTAVWTLGGLACQIALLALLAIACVVVSGHRLAALLAPIPFVLGTFSVVTTGTWLTQMHSHAVLWGPFAVLFPLNGEAAGLCAGASALILLVLAYRTPAFGGARMAFGLVAAALIGLDANVHTYAFLSVTFLAAYCVAAVALGHSKNWWLIVGSVVLVPVVFVLGPVIAKNFGQLATMAFGLLPAVPGLIAGIVRSRGFLVLCGAVAVACAAPSVVSTLIGLKERDPFLVYRVASSVNLEVEPTSGLIASAALLLPLALIFAAGILHRTTMWIAFPPGVVVAWLLIATNDRWGADQEPYRFWIDGFVLTAVVTLVVFTWVASTYLRGRTTGSAVAIAGSERIIATVALIAVVATAGVSALDWQRFTSDTAKSLTFLSYSGPREKAIQLAAESAGDGLILTDPCVDPIIVKVTSGARVLYMNKGMAWPREYQAVFDLLDARTLETVDQKAARKAGVDWLMTDSACAVDWAAKYEDQLSDPVVARYADPAGDSTITLWRFEPGS